MADRRSPHAEPQVHLMEMGHIPEPHSWVHTSSFGNNMLTTNSTTPAPGPALNPLRGKLDAPANAGVAAKLDAPALQV